MIPVEDAPGFAAILARDEGISDQWEKAHATGKESFVPLPRGIPVLGRDALGKLGADVVQKLVAKMGLRDGFI